MDSGSHYHDFVHALALINIAIGARHVVLPFDQAIDEQSRTSDPPEFGVAIYEESPEDPVDYFTIRLQDGRFVLTQHGVPHAAPDWVVSAEHLREIFRNPLRFVDDPSRFDLSWLQSCSATVVA
ncbi:MAG: hypothetical protein DWQ34_26960 [Planctomycetota bacterium]|nr:MAG: hypothetical protein DWQ29_13580 [Planctomycetota bacterium]REJ86615.1 MAG: hypothetical protein DWQ34_26960 [Planctomycetota bacterium]REK28466.1 MAG: hypothetical protein DWQ41_05810 [Planctomycetota bacterium]REK29115.1 MAG: hypothetical protein DWQ45_23525 [Planctomycetota bacterium]